MIYCNYLINAYKTLVINTFKLVGILSNKGGVPKRSNGAGCKPVDFGLRKFNLPPPTKIGLITN